MVYFHKKIFSLKFLIFSLLGYATFVQASCGIDAFNTGKYKIAGKQFSDLARRGDKDSQFCLATMYEIGLGMKEDADQALDWYEMAAKNGQRDAQHALGTMYAVGYYGKTKNIHPNKQLATEWEIKAAAQGQIDAQRYLALVENMPIWLKILAERGDRKAQTRLAYNYSNGINVLKNDEISLKWDEQAAENGSEISQRNLVFSYFEGVGVEKNSTKALQWLEKLSIHGNTDDILMLVHRKFSYSDKVLQTLAIKGDPLIQFALGYSLFHNGTNESQRQGFAWLKTSAEAGNSFAQMELMFIYSAGRNMVGKNNIEAFKWAKRAADQGLVKAYAYLGRFYQLGKGTEKDDKKSFQAYLKGAEQGDEVGTLTSLDDILNHGIALAPAIEKGNADAYYLLGFMYENNFLEYRAQTGLAAYWYERAAKKGHERAEKRLAKLIFSTP